MTDPIKALIRSVFLVAMISAALGILTGFVFASVAIGFCVFFLSCIIQFLLGYFIGEAKQARDVKQTLLLEQIVQDFDGKKFPVDLSCAYCNMSNRAAISPTQDNIFACSGCNQPNKVFIQFTTVRITTPLAAKVEPSEIPIDDEDVASVRQTAISDKATITG